MPNGGSWLARQGASGSKYHRVWGFNYALGLNNSHSVWRSFFIFDVYAVLWGWRFGVDPKGERHGRKRGKRGKGE